VLGVWDFIDSSTSKQLAIFTGKTIEHRPDPRAQVFDVEETAGCRLLKKPGNGPKRHTGRDEVEIRYPVNYCFFWIPDSRFAPSGMTDLMLALKIFSFAAAC